MIFFIPVLLAIIAMAMNNLQGGHVCGTILGGLAGFVGGLYLMYLFPVLLWVSIGLGTAANIALRIH